MPATWRRPSPTRTSTCPPGNSATARRAGQPWEIPIDALGRLSDPEQFGEIIVKVGPSTAVPMSTVAGLSAAERAALQALRDRRALRHGRRSERSDEPRESRVDDSQRRHHGHRRPGQQLRRHGGHGDHGRHRCRRRPTAVAHGQRRRDRRRRHDQRSAARGHGAGAARRSAAARFRPWTVPPHTTSAARPRVPARRRSSARRGPSVGIVRLRDIARVEMGARTTPRRRPSTAISPWALPSSNSPAPTPWTSPTA